MLISSSGFGWQSEVKNKSKSRTSTYGSLTLSNPAPPPPSSCFLNTVWLYLILSFLYLTTLHLAKCVGKQEQGRARPLSWKRRFPHKMFPHTYTHKIRIVFIILGILSLCCSCYISTTRGIFKPKSPETKIHVFVQLFTFNVFLCHSSCESYLVSLVDAVNKLLRWRVPCEADGGRVDSDNFHSLRRRCGNYTKINTHTRCS